jgi:WD40 repeat protein
MELTGHSGEIFCGQFDPNGNYIASGSMDRSISEFTMCSVTLMCINAS